MSSMFEDEDYYYELDGLFSSIKKAVSRVTDVKKKVASTLTNAAKKKASTAISLAKKKAATVKKIQDSKKAVLTGKQGIKSAVSTGFKSIKTDMGKGYSAIKEDVRSTQREGEAAVLSEKQFDKLQDFKASDEFKTAQKIVGTAVATYFGGPIAGKLIGGAFSAAGATGIGSAIAAKGAALGAGSLTGAIGKKLVTTGVSELAKKTLTKKLQERASDQQKAFAVKADAAMKAELERDLKRIVQLSSDPKIQGKMEELRRQGYGIQQIEEAWANSTYFQDLVRAEVPKTVYPLIYDELRAQGLPKEFSQDQAANMAQQMTDESATEIAQQAGGVDLKQILTIGLPIAAALFLGA